MKAHIVGGGVAGFAAAVGLLRGGYRVVVYEKEPLPFTFASSRNAAIFRTYEADPVVSRLVKESYLQLMELEGRGNLFLRKNGLFLSPNELDYYESSLIDQYGAGAAGIRSQKGDYHNEEIAIGLDGFFLPGNGVLDIHAIQNYFMKILNASPDAVVEYNVRISGLETIGNKISGVVLEKGSGEEKVSLGENDLLVNAAGSWSADLVRGAGLWVPPVFPHKRHLFFVKSKTVFDQNMPVLWDEKNDFYLRFETGGILASHCDQRVVQPDDYNADPRQEELFLTAFMQLYPALKESHIARYWACLRTFTFDGVPVVGYDPEISNLFWFTGWGGKGMSLSFIMPDLVVRMLGSNAEKPVNPFSPDRFY